MLLFLRRICHVPSVLSSLFTPRCRHLAADALLSREAHPQRAQPATTYCMPRRLSSCYNDDMCSKLDLGPGHPRQRRQLRLLVHLDDVNGLGQQLLRVSCYGTWLPYMYHTCMAHGRFERTIGQKCALFANYVPNVLRHGVLRDPNHSLRIEYTLQWFSKLGPSKRAVRCPNRPKLSYSSVTYAQKSM